MFISIFALGKNNEIGKNGDMPWGRKLSSDLKFTKNLTMGKNLVMGVNTFKSLPKILPGREHYIVTHDPSKINDPKFDLSNPMIHIISDFEKFLKENENSSETYIIFGGKSIYEMAMPYCKAIYVTKIDQSFDDSDTFLNFNINEDLYYIKKLDIISENSLTYTRYLYTKK